MNITLNNDEIDLALVDYVQKQGIDLSHSEVKVSLTAGRGENGTTASIEITKSNQPSIPTGLIPRGASSMQTVTMDTSVQSVEDFNLTKVTAKTVEDTVAAVAAMEEEDLAPEDVPEDEAVDGSASLFKS